MSHQILIGLVSILLVILAFVRIYQISTRDYTKQPTPQGRLFGAVIGFAAGLFFLWSANNEQQMALASIKWPTSDGRITYSYSQLFAALDRRGASVRYSYTIHGQTYSNDNIAFNSIWAQRSCDAEKVYPVGAIVKVHYLPSDPSHSCLEIGNRNFLGWRFYLSVGLFVLALLTLFNVK